MHLGLSRGDFLELRPTEMIFMARSYRRAREDEQWRDATLMACIVNSGMARPKDGVKPSDFMPKPQDAPRRAHRRMTTKRRQEVADGLRRVMARYLKKDSA